MRKSLASLLIDPAGLAPRACRGDTRDRNDLDR